MGSNVFKMAKWLVRFRTNEGEPNRVEKAWKTTSIQVASTSKVTFLSYQHFCSIKFQIKFHESFKGCNNEWSSLKTSSSATSIANSEYRRVVGKNCHLIDCETYSKDTLFWSCIIYFVNYFPFNKTLLRCFLIENVWIQNCSSIIKLYISIPMFFYLFFNMFFMTQHESFVAPKRSTRKRRWTFWWPFSSLFLSSVVAIVVIVVF